MSTEVAITTSTSLPVVPNGHEAVSNGSVSKSNESAATTQTSNIVVSVVAVSSSPSFIPSTSAPAPQLFSSPHPLGPNPLAAAYQTLYPGAYPYQYPFLPFPAPFPGAFPAVPYDPQALAPLTSYLPSVMAPLRPPFMSHTPVGPLFFGQTSLGPTSEPAVTSSANSTQPTSNSQTAIDSNGTSGTAATSLSAIKARTGSSRGLLGSTPPGQKSGQRTNLNGTSASNSNSSPNKGINYGGFRNYGGFSKQTVYSHGSSNHRTLEAANNYGGFATISSTSSSHNSVSQNTSSASVLKSSRPESGPNTKQDLPSLKEEDQTRLDQEKKELQEKTNKTIESLDWKSPRNRYFVIKSFTEENIQRSIKFGVWCSTEAGNKRLNDAFHSVTRARPDASTGEDAAPGHVYLFFSVNMSGFFSGIAEMVGAVNASIDPGDIWEQTRSGARWRGLFPVRWLYVRDVPNDALNHITVATNDGKPVTHSRDTTEVPRAQGEQVFEIIARHEKVTTSLFDDYIYYERCRLHRHLGIVFADDWRKEHDL